MNEQTKPYRYEAPSPKGTLFDDTNYEARLDFHEYGVDSGYNPQKIAEVRDTPIFREPTLEELNEMAVGQAAAQLEYLQVLRFEQKKA